MLIFLILMLIGYVSVPSSSTPESGSPKTWYTPASIPTQTYTPNTVKSPSVPVTPAPYEEITSEDFSNAIAGKPASSYPGGGYPAASQPSGSDAAAP